MSSVRILFLASNPSTIGRLALDEECAAIDRELRMASHRDFEFVSRWAVTVDELMRHFDELRPTVVHFSGHGAPSHAGPSAGPGAPAPGRELTVLGARERPRGGIYLHDERGGAQLVTGAALSRMVKAAAPSARLVVLNACYSEAQAEVVCGAVDCVVGMVGAIEDTSARSFAVAFYRALGHRRSVGNAFDQAIATLAGKNLPGEHHPRWRCRPGLDASQIFLSGRPRNDPP